MIRACSTLPALIAVLELALELALPLASRRGRLHRVQNTRGSTSDDDSHMAAAMVQDRRHSRLGLTQHAAACCTSPALPTTPELAPSGGQDKNAATALLTTIPGCRADMRRSQLRLSVHPPALSTPPDLALSVASRRTHQHRVQEKRDTQVDEPWRTITVPEHFECADDGTRLQKRRSDYG